MESNKTYTVKEIAQLLDFSTNTVYKYLEEGKIKATRLGEEGRFRIPESEVARLLQVYKGRSSLGQAVFEPAPNPPVAIIDKETVNQSDELFQNVTEKNLVGFPNLFEWLAGFMGIFVGVVYFLFPLGLLKGDSNLYLNFAKYLQISLIFTGLGFLLSEIFISEKKLLHKVFHFSLAGLLAFFAFFSWKTINPMTTFELGAISLLLFLNIFIMRTGGKIKYVVLINVINLTYSLFLIFLPASLGTVVLAKGVFGLFNFSVLWGLYCFAALFLSLALLRGKKDSVWTKIALSVLFSAVWLSLRSAVSVNYNLSEMASSMVLIGFILIFPFWKNINSNTSARDRKTIAFSLGLLLFFLALGLLIISFAYRSFKEYIFTEIGRRADSGVVLVSSFMERAKDKTIVFSKNNELNLSVSGSDLERINKILKENYLSSSAVFRRVYVVNTEGRIIAAYPYENSMIDLDVSDREYFQQIKNGQKFYLSSALKPLVDTAPVILVLSAPISDDNGLLVGIIVTSVSLEDLNNELDKVKLSNQGYFKIVDENTNYLTNPDKNLLYTPILNDPLSALAFQGERGEVRVYDSAGKLSFQAYRPITNLGWGLVVQEDYNAIFSTYRTVSSIVFLLVVVLNIGVLTMINFLKE